MTIAYLTPEDPQIRQDGTCYVCHKPRRISRPPTKDIPASYYTNDPFCSSTCCRTHHGLTLPPIIGRPRRNAKLAA